MDRRTLVDHLALARDHVAQGRLHIAKQHVLIARLERHGRDTGKALETLRLFEAMQAEHVADCERLERALVQGDAPFSSGDDFRRAQGTEEVTRESMNEVRWYWSKIAESADVLQRSKDAVDTSREMLLKLDGGYLTKPAGGSDSGSSGGPRSSVV